MDVYRQSFFQIATSTVFLHAILMKLGTHVLRANMHKADFRNFVFIIVVANCLNFIFGLSSCEAL